MESSAETRFWRSSGTISLAALLAFCIAAFSMLIASGSGTNNWPPLAYLVSIFLFTVIQASLSTLLSMVFALPLALAMARRQAFAGRRVILAMMVLPLGLPVLPAIFGILEIWGRQGLVNDILRWAGVADGFSVYGLSGILLAHVFFNLPLAARFMLKSLEKIPRDEWKLAASLGLSRWLLFRIVEGPAILRVLPGIAGLIFMLCVTSFTIVLTLGGGPQTSTLEVAIYQALKFEFDPGRAMLLSLAQFALTAAIFWLLHVVPDPEEDRRGIEGQAFRVDGRMGASKLADSALILLFILFVGAPVIAIVVAGLKADLGRLTSSPRFWQALRTSLVIAFSAGLLATIITYLMARAQASIGTSRWAGLLFRFPEFMLLIPPLALGSGWFLLLLKLGVSDGAAVVLVVLINMGMALPFASRLIAPELQTHLKRTARLSASLGIAGWSRFRIIDWPVMKTPLLTAFGFAAALSLGDMGAIALFGSDGFITLPSLLYASLGSYRSTDAAGLALILAALCLILTLPSIRQGARNAGETS